MKRLLTTTRRRKSVFNGLIMKEKQEECGLTRQESAVSAKRIPASAHTAINRWRYLHLPLVPNDISNFFFVTVRCM